MYAELGKLVRNTYVKCVGPLEQEVTTMDLLKRIELRMETLTQQLERLPAEKVKIAQRVSIEMQRSWLVEVRGCEVKGNNKYYAAEAAQQQPNQQANDCLKPTSKKPTLLLLT